MAKRKQIDVEIEWAMQPRQLEFLRACGLAYMFDGTGIATKPEARMILYGGSAGGGKTDSLLMAGLIACVTWPGCKVGYFRRRYPDLEGPGGAIMRSHELYITLAKYHGGNRRWNFVKGGVVQFCHCQNEDDVYNYNSQQFDILMLDESTQFSEFQIRYLLSRNRATVNGVIPFCAMATNPGGVSHDYHLKQFVEIGMPGEPKEVEVEKGRFEKHVFIPARLEDNQVLEERDPGYRTTLENMPEEMRKALLEGSWYVFKGQYFRDFNKDKHIVKSFEIPSDWRKFASVDWGFAAPCAVLFHAIDPSSGRIYTYDEIYVTQKRAADVAAMVKERSKGVELEYIKMSPDAWHERGLGSKASPGEVIAEEFTKIGLNVEPADNRRILGWQRMREYLAIAPDGEPWWQIFPECENLIRTLPTLIHDRNRVEDVHGDCEDHAAESARYFLFSRPSPVDGASFMPGSREYYSDSEDDDDDLDDGVPEVAAWYGL